MKAEKYLLDMIEDLDVWRSRLATLMRKKELTVVATAKDIGIDRLTLGRFITGERVPDFVTVSKILNWIEKEEKQLGEAL